MINSWLFLCLLSNAWIRTWVTNNIHSDNTASIRNLTAERWLNCRHVELFSSSPLHQNENVMDTIDFDRFNKESSFYCFNVCCCQDGLDMCWPPRPKYDADSGPRCTRQFWWEVSFCGSVCAPAAVSLIPCAGGVGTGLPATPSACPTLCVCVLWRLPWLKLWTHRLTARHLSAEFVFSPWHVT